MSNVIYLLDHVKHSVVYLNEETHKKIIIVLLYDEIETRPACYHHNCTIGGLDFLYTDLELMVDVLHQSILSHTITDHRNLDTLFELAHAVYAVLKAFQKKYI